MEGSEGGPLHGPFFDGWSYRGYAVANPAAARGNGTLCCKPMTKAVGGPEPWLTTDDIAVGGLVLPRLETDYEGGWRGTWNRHPWL